MKPLKDCIMCDGDGIYPEPRGESGGVPCVEYVSCPCLDREPETDEEEITDKEKIISFANALMDAKNDTIPDLVYGSNLYPILSQFEMKIDRAFKELIEQTGRLK